MEDVRELVPRKLPEGFLTWAAAALEGELDTHGFLYEVEWVEDYGLDFLLDEWARAKKRKMVRVQCSCCGYEDRYHYGKGQWGYGFVLPESYTEVEGGTVYEDGDSILCPSCGCPVQIRRRAGLKGRGYFVPAESRAMSAAVVGNERLLVLTGWVLQRRVFYGGGERLEAIPAEAYVFSARDCAQLMGWANAYSGTAGYFIQYTRAWRQPRNWTDRWGNEEHIFGLTEELLEESSLPHCKLDVYMEHRPGAYHFPVEWLRLCQAHPNAEAALIHGLPRVLDDLIYAKCRLEQNKQGDIEVHELDWSQTKPARMLHLNREELRLAREQDWGRLFWDLFRYSKAAGELLTGEDMVNAFRLGDEHVGQLVGRGPVAKSIRYLLGQCELAETGYVPEPEDEDPPAYAAVPDVQILTDYWNMAQRLGWDLTNERVRFPHDLFAAHDEAAAQAAQREEKGLAAKFRVRRMVLRKYVFAADGLLIRPAGSQKELTDEGNTLHHCVGTYGKKHANGETAIFFIRKKTAPRESYFTLELDEQGLTVRQNRGMRNGPRTPEVLAFEELWLSWVRAGAPRDKTGRPVVEVVTSWTA
ncbi:MAG: PcfJ domain-containing protein [Oscillospiraceae bacterium]|nr:PcfJ domain-containing protein [Oscillospiraceae bacterium]